MKKLNIIAIFLIIVVVFSACGKTDVRTSDEFLIVTSFYPMYVFTKNITEGAENVKVINMTEPQTGCLHDYQLLPKDIKTLEEADVFVINGGGMESFMEKVYENVNTLRVITASEGIEYLSMECGKHHNHSHEHAHEEFNSHVWTYIPGAITEIENIAKGLAAANPENEKLYKDNAKKYTGSLELIHEEFEEFAEKSRNIKMIVTHEAFDYMAKGYGFEITGHIAGGHNTAPSAGEISELVDIIRDEKITGIFKEVQYAEETVNILQKETGANVFMLDAMVTGNDKYIGVYESVMKNNLEVLKNASKQK